MNVLSPYVRTALDYTVPPDWELKERVIFDYELFYVKKGMINFVVEDVEYMGRMGDVFLIHPKQRHHIVSIGDELFQHPHVHFDLFEDEYSENIPVNFLPLYEVIPDDHIYFREDVLAKDPYNLGIRIDLIDPEFIYKQILTIVHLFEQHEHVSDIECKGLILSLLAYILRQQKTIQHTSNGFNPALIYGEELLRKSDEILTISQIAKQCGYSRAHFIHTFEEAYGLSPHQYRISIRMSRASNLLRNSNLPIKIIAEMCGYESIYSFSNAFKNWSGFSPSAYRK